MAVLTNADYKALRGYAYRTDVAKADFKGLTNLPNETQLKAAFQAIEDRLVNAFANIKADIETAFGGVTITNNLAKKIILAFFVWRVSKGG